LAPTAVVANIPSTCYLVNTPRLRVVASVQVVAKILDDLCENTLITIVTAVPPLAHVVVD
jgi:hypothetical protein